MCVATGHTEPDIVGTELEASQSLVCLYESEQVREQSKKKKIELQASNVPEDALKWL